jgi:AAA+ superfamily predicted ATPase
MVIKTNFPNAKYLQNDFAWFSKILEERFRNYFNSSNEHFEISSIPLPKFEKSSSPYSEFIQHHKLNAAERLILVLSLVPHVQPKLLDIFFTRNEIFNRGYTEFGGIKGKYYSGFLPTGETAMFILAGSDIEERIRYSQIFEQEHFFYKYKILQLNYKNTNEPYLSGALQLSDEYVDYFTSGKIKQPNFSLTFPAKAISTKLDWADVILEEQTRNQVMEIISWLEHGEAILKEWKKDKRILPGYSCLFYGPSGTGKTLTAAIIGKMTGKEVYRVDLSMVISKYIGETEKNLSKIFNTAENKGWILFFDEADALFGKRTSIRDSHDRFANQEVSYLLQKVEDYDGLVILATSFNNSLGEAFLRRFQSIVHFPMPGPEERFQLWKKMIPSAGKLHKSIDLQNIAENNEISGGSIINVLRYATLMAVKNSDGIIQNHDLQEGINREIRKKEKTFN